MRKFGKRSLANLMSVDKRLILLFAYALNTSPVDFSIIDGKRSIEKQKFLLRTGKTRTLKSKHLDGLAVDAVPYPVDWKDTKRFKQLAEHIKDCAEKLSIPIKWGGDWKNFVDMPHYELIERG